MGDSLNVPAQTTKGWQAAFGVLLALGVGVGPFLHFGLPATAPYIGSELDVSRTGFGALASALALVGGVMSPAMGSFVDRYGGRRLLMLAFALGGSSLIVLGVSGSYHFLFVGATLAGLSMAISVPATNLLVAQELPSRQHGLFVGIKQSGVQVGQFLAGALLPTGALLLGWRGAFVLAGAAVFGGVLATALLVRPDERRVKTETVQLPRREALQPIVLLLMAYSVLIGAGILSVNTYLPLYAFEELGIPAAVAGLTIGAIGFVGAVSRVACGMLIQHARSPVRLLSWAALSSAAAASCFVGADYLWMPLLWIGIPLFGVAAGMWNVVAMYLVVRHVPKRATGRATGMVMLAYYAGLMLGPLLVGPLVDATDAYVVGWGVVAASFVVASLLVLALQGK